MRHTKTILFLSAFVLLVSTARARTGDWQAVRNLPPGTRISVRSHRVFGRDTCFFLHATDDHLVCERALHRRSRILIVLPIPSEVVHERSRVREVRVEHSEDANTLAGVGIGAGIGAALGAGVSNGAMTRGPGVILGSGIGALVGGTFISKFPIIHGKVIYRR